MGTFNETTALRSAADVEKWVGEHSLDALEEKMIEPTFGDTNLLVARNWLNLQRDRKAAVDAERALKATETSATAASQSADSAVKSVSWAKAAFAVSIVALVVSFFKS